MVPHWVEHAGQSWRRWPLLVVLTESVLVAHAKGSTVIFPRWEFPQVSTQPAAEGDRFRVALVHNRDGRYDFYWNTFKEAATFVEWALGRPET